MITGYTRRHHEILKQGGRVMVNAPLKPQFKVGSIITVGQVFSDPIKVRITMVISKSFFSPYLNKIQLVKV